MPLGASNRYSADGSRPTGSGAKERRKQKRAAEGRKEAYERDREEAEQVEAAAAPQERAEAQATPQNPAEAVGSPDLTPKTEEELLGRFYELREKLRDKYGKQPAGAVPGWRRPDGDDRENGAEGQTRRKFAKAGSSEAGGAAQQLPPAVESRDAAASSADAAAGCDREAVSDESVPAKAAEEPAVEAAASVCEAPLPAAEAARPEAPQREAEVSAGPEGGLPGGEGKDRQEAVKGLMKKVIGAAASSLDRGLEIFRYLKAKAW